VCTADSVAKLLQDLFLVVDRKAAETYIERAFPGRDLTPGMKLADCEVLYQVALQAQPLWTDALTRSASAAALTANDVHSHEDQVRQVFNRHADKSGKLSLQKVGQFLSDTGVMDSAAYTPRFLDEFQVKHKLGSVSFPEVIGLCNTAFVHTLKKSDTKLSSLVPKESLLPKHGMLASLKADLGTEATGLAAQSLRRRRQERTNWASQGMLVVRSGGLTRSNSNGTWVTSVADPAAPRDTGPPELTVAGTVEGGECSGHSLAPLRAAAWVLTEDQEAGSERVLVPVEGDDLLESCQQAIADTKNSSSPSYDLDLARALASANRVSRAEARARGFEAPGAKAPEKEGVLRKCWQEPEAAVSSEAADFQFPRLQQPPPEYFEQRKAARTRVPGRGKVLASPSETDAAQSEVASEKEQASLDVAAAPGVSSGLSRWKVMCSPHVAVRAKPKATGKLVGQLYTGEEILCENEDHLPWLRILEVPGRQLPSEAWVLSDVHLTEATDIGIGILLKRTCNR
ncbi:unnamed protein product, partial [Polarella glacialis]